MDMTRLDITFDVYSGRQNPALTLTGADADAVLAMLAPGAEIGPDELADRPPHLGYRGLVFTQHGVRDSVLPARFRLIAGRLIGPGLRHWVADPSVEDLICSGEGLAGLVFSDEGRARLAEGLAYARTDGWWQPPSGQVPGSLVVTPCATAPAAGFHRWNDARARLSGCLNNVPRWCRQCVNNCYNYATNVRTDSFGQPGYASGKVPPTRAVDAALILRYAFYDGLIYTTGMTATTCLTGQILVALVIDPTRADEDYHWYRRNSDGYWGHKQGSDPATDVDESGNKITDPQTCDRGPYTIWGGYMLVVPGSVRIGGPVAQAPTRAALPAGFQLGSR